MLKIKKVYYKLVWWRSESPNLGIYRNFDTAEEADAFIKSELKDAENIEVAKYYVLKKDVKQFAKAGANND